MLSRQNLWVFHLKACPKCRGALQFRVGECSERYVACINCGWSKESWTFEQPVVLAEPTKAK